MLRLYKLWGGRRKEKNALYVWAADMDEAMRYAREQDKSIDTAQWTGKSGDTEQKGVCND